MSRKLTLDEQRDLENWFTYHPPTNVTLSQYAHVRESTKELARWIMENLPPSGDRAFALRQLRRVTMDVNLCIACNPPSE